MLTLPEIIAARKRLNKRPDDSQLRRLPYRSAYVYGRLSSPQQVRDSQESVREIAKLVKLAKEDGYRSNLSSEEVEQWLTSIQKGTTQVGVREEKQIIVDVRDLGLSGQLSAEKREGLASLQRRIKDGWVGAVYLTEGVSRLSRDRDHILPYQLLKLLKEHQCRLRTPEGIWNPAVERDWEYLAEEFEDAIDELRVMNRRMHRRKAQKASRGESVGEPIPAGFILPVVGRKANGKYEYGRMEPYLPHAEVVERILTEFVWQGGSGLKTVRALGALTIPFFPSELSHMDRLTALRRCTREATGYKITPALVYGLATNPKLIGAWQWGNSEPIMKNHEPAVTLELFLQAYELANVQGKAKGRAMNSERMEWAGLLWCNNHPEPHLISGHGAEGRYVCSRDYQKGQGSVCLDISGRFIDEPLTTTILHRLDFTPAAEEVFAKLEADARRGSLDQIEYKQQVAKLEQEVKKWQKFLSTCYNCETDTVDKEKETYYWEQIREAENELAGLKAKPVLRDAQTTADFAKVRDFLIRLPRDWDKYPKALRNRLLKLVIEKVELSGTYDIEATITWRAGFKQKVIIHRPPARSRRERRWTHEENDLLSMLYTSSSTDAITAALPGRTWSAIAARAARLKLARKRAYHPPRDWRPWTLGEDSRLKLHYEAGMPLKDIAGDLRRSVDSVETRAANKGLSRPRANKWRRSKVSWETQELVPLQLESSDR
jgi:DNA invertase Pin-like site-specific DNA recombinase